jgi:hypothetical protein
LPQLPPEAVQPFVEEGAGEVSALFLVRGLTSSELLSRIVGLLAQQSRTPRNVSMRRVGGALVIRIALDEIDGQRARILAEKMRSLAIVRSVKLQLWSSQVA